MERFEMNPRGIAWFGLVAVTLAAAACFTVSSDWTSGGGGGADAGDDATEGGGDDAGDVGTPDAGPSYHDITDASQWQVFDLSTVDRAATGFLSAAFDGRTLYLSPGPGSSLVVAYDTRQHFDVGASYSTWYPNTVDPRAAGFGGAVFDGRYVYLVPNSINGSSPDGVVVRYDTPMPFGTPASLALFDMAAAMVSLPPAPAAQGFTGASIVPDAGYLYFAPIAAGGLVVRYQLAAPYDAGASYTAQDESAVAPGPFAGAAFDGRYVYFVPAATGQVMQIDTTMAFGSSASYQMFDLKTWDPSAFAFMGATFDGRYLYLVPHGQGHAVRYDTRKSFKATASYEYFDLRLLPGQAGMPASFAGAVFDGHYVYFAPNDSNFAVRVDTQQPFTAMSSWSYFNLNKIVPDSGVQGYRGAAFDGRYVYLVPGTSTILARFDARTPPSMPTTYTGSFF